MLKKLFLFFGFFFLFNHTAFAAKYLTSDDINKLSSSPAKFRFNYGDGSYQFADLRIPSGRGPFPVAVLIHGGCWLSKYADLKIMDPMATALTRAGIATWNIEYRRVDNPGGGWPGTFQDVGNAIDYLQTIAGDNYLDLNRVVIIGHSAGGHLALWAAARHKLPENSALYSSRVLPIRGVIDLAGPGNLMSFIPLQEEVCNEKIITKMMGGTPTEKPDRYAQGSPSELLPLGVKQILFTGEDDISVPPKLGEAYLLAAKKEDDDVEFITVENAAHFELISPESKAWPDIKQTVLGLLKD